jgi:hypothetical protein
MCCFGNLEVELDILNQVELLSANVCTCLRERSHVFAVNTSLAGQVRLSTQYKRVLLQQTEQQLLTAGITSISSIQYELLKQ